MTGRPVKNLGQIGDQNTRLDHAPELHPHRYPPLCQTCILGQLQANKVLATLHNATYPCLGPELISLRRLHSLTSIPRLRALHIDAQCNGKSSIRALHSDRPQNAPRNPEGLKAGPQVQCLRARGLFLFAEKKKKKLRPSTRVMLYNGPRFPPFSMISTSHLISFACISYLSS